MSCEITGEISYWNFERKFGFAVFEDAAGRRQRAFVPYTECVGDAIGRISDCWTVGNVVTFKLAPRVHHGKSSIVATEVTPVFREQHVGDPSEHREVSRILRWVNVGRDGFLVRPTLEELYFCIQRAATSAHRELFEGLREGQRVYHGIRSRVRNGVLAFEADQIEVFSPAEQVQFERAEKESEPASVLAPERRNKTLRELVFEEKGK